MPRRTVKAKLTSHAGSSLCHWLWSSVETSNTPVITKLRFPSREGQSTGLTERLPYSRPVARVLAAFLLLSSIAGCASVPLLIREPPADNPTLADVQTNPPAFMNRRVRWGGIIVSTRSVENGTEVEILAKALGNDGRPEPGDVSLGRFLVNSDGFLDPAVYSAGREVTVYGGLQNALVRNIGTRPYLYPLVKAVQLYLWTEQSYDDWYSPFHFGFGVGVGI